MLSARIAKGPLPLDQALACAIQIADALDRAHRAGVTHRDVKPANIMLNRGGAKVLDFGLSKSTAQVAPTEATLTQAITGEGVVMGTPQYMAPELFGGERNLTSISPDGKSLLCGGNDIMRLAPPETGRTKPDEKQQGSVRSEEYLRTKFSEGYGVFSPDCRWVAYRSDESGRYEIYLQGYPEKQGKWLVSSAGGSLSAWRADGKDSAF